MDPHVWFGTLVQSDFNRNHHLKMVESEDLYYEKQRIIMHLDPRKELPLSEHDDLAVFPPINHENIYIDVFENSPSESSSSSSSSDSDEQFEFNPKPQCQPAQTNRRSPPFWWWWKLLLTRALSKFRTLMTLFSISSLCSFSTNFRPLYPVLGIVIWWWRRSREIKLEAYLRDTIKEKDERIAQLLHQIVQMNELLVKNKHSR